MEFFAGNQMEEDENDLFYFESDHLALRGNKDYSEILKSIFVLEAQRQKAIQDYNKIIELKEESLNDPINCVEKLKSGTLNIPEVQTIIDLPKINWSKYDVKVPPQYLKQLSSDYQTKDVRFDVKDGKSHTKPWTTEEQRKLEDLLVKYPPEEVESRRIKKISNELGNRTPQQVSSRLQKYYLKLIKAGLPVPGRLPKSKSYDKKNPNKKHGKHKYMKPSTFFPDLDIPVVMNELDQVPGPSSSFKASDKDQSSNYLMPHSYHEDKSSSETSDLDVQIELLKKIKMEKIYEESENSQPYPHYGFKCDYCEEEPIEGSRWHCSTCNTSSVDYCTDCMLSQMYSENPHQIKHKFITIRSDKEVVNSSSSESGSASGSSVKNEESSSSEFSEEEEEVEEVKKEEEELLFSVESSSNSFKFEVSESCPSNIFDCAEYNGDGHTSNGF